MIFDLGEFVVLPLSWNEYEALNVWSAAWSQMPANYRESLFRSLV